MYISICLVCIHVYVNKAGFHLYTISGRHWEITGKKSLTCVVLPLCDTLHKILLTHSFLNLSLAATYISGFNEGKKKLWL